MKGLYKIINILDKVSIFSRWTNIIGIAALFLMIVFNFIDTIMDVVIFHRPIKGVTEITEIMMICGISLALAHCQDEKAHIYILNLEQEKIVKKYDFGEDGDYEDIVVMGKTAYVLRNNGHIYRIGNFKKKERKVKKFNTPFKERNDTEGMAYDPLSNTLLIACKGSPSLDKKNRYLTSTQCGLSSAYRMGYLCRRIIVGRLCTRPDRYDRS